MKTGRGIQKLEGEKERGKIKKGGSGGKRKTRAKQSRGKRIMSMELHSKKEKNRKVKGNW